MKNIAALCVVTLLLFLIPNDLKAQSSDSEQIENITVHVKGVGCNEDVKSIKANIEKLNGVQSCKPLKRGATTKFQVAFDPNSTSKDLIWVAVEDTPGCKNPNKRPYKVKNKE